MVPGTPQGGVFLASSAVIQNLGLDLIGIFMFV